MSAWPIDHGAPKRQSRGSILGRKATYLYGTTVYETCAHLELVCFLREVEGSSHEPRRWGELHDRSPRRVQFAGTAARFGTRLGTLGHSNKLLQGLVRINIRAAKRLTNELVNVLNQRQLTPTTG